ncbi:recombinase family protein [Nocardia sp. NPDC052112]|uniref:recombinase family protein n=1 Tax=Nocardia sp. NPDC052112 TaxID=3155646 RepID=UPI00342F09A1
MALLSAGSPAPRRHSGGAVGGSARPRSAGPDLDRGPGLRKCGIGFRSLHEALDTTTPGGRLVLRVFAAPAEFIRELIVDGTNEGLAAARAREQRLGWPPVMIAEQIRQACAILTRPEETVSSVTRLLGVSRGTHYKNVPELRTGGWVAIENRPPRTTGGVSLVRVYCSLGGSRRRRASSWTTARRRLCRQGCRMSGRYPPATRPPTRCLELVTAGITSGCCDGCSRDCHATTSRCGGRSVDIRCRTAMGSATFAGSRNTCAGERIDARCYLHHEYWAMSLTCAVSVQRSARSG